MTPTRAQLKEIRASIVGPLTIPKNGEQPASERDVLNALAIALRAGETLLEKSSIEVLEKSSGETAAGYRKACMALRDVFGYLESTVIPRAAQPAAAARNATMTRAKILALKPTAQSAFFSQGGRILG